MTLASKSYVFDPRPNYPLVSTAKRYWRPSSPHLDDPTAVTLIFAHGTGFHKEQWEAAIDDLCSIVERKGGVKLREFWSIDAPNHGDAAGLNADVLKWGYKKTFRWEDYARSLHAFLTGLGTGVDTDFSKHRLVGIGHSMGAVGILLSNTFHPIIHFEMLILVEIMIMDQVVGEATQFLATGATNRRDIWPSKEEAYTLLKSRPPWKTWDDRILRIYVNEGMVSLPTKEYPDKTEGVTLKCTRAQETASYTDELGYSRAYRLLGPLAKRIPIHLVYGSVDDYIPAAVKEDVIKNAAEGALASVRRVPNAGHLAPQQNPIGTAEKLYDCLVGLSSRARL